MLFLGSKVAANTAFLVELRALALAVLAVCCESAVLLQFVPRFELFVAEACNGPALAAPTLLHGRSRRLPRVALNSQLAACKATSKQTRNAHAAV